MKSPTEHTPFRLCAIAALLAGLSGAAWADEQRDAAIAEQLANQAKMEAVAAISASRDSTIADLVWKWSSAAANLGYDATAWAADFTAALQGASDAQLYDITNASSYSGVNAILQGRSAPASVDGVVGAENLGDTTNDLVYTPVTPCRVLDTRFGTGTYAGPIPAGSVRNYFVYGSNALLAPQGHTAGTGCSSPRGEPVAMAANFTVVPTVSGHIRVYPYLAPLPNASFLNFQPGANLANAGIIATCYNCGQELSVYNNATVNYIADVMGYFYPVSQADPSFNEVKETTFASGGVTASPLASDNVVRFIGPTTTHTLVSGDRVQIIAHQAVGTTTSAGGLGIYPCYRLSGSTGTPTTIGGAMLGLSMTSGVRIPISVSGVATPGVGTFNFGMCYQNTSPNWNLNEWGYVTTTVLNF